MPLPPSQTLSSTPSETNTNATISSHSTNKSSFMINYEECCKEDRSRLKVKTQAKDRCLEFNADRLELKDWGPLIKAIKSDTTLHTITVKSEYPRKKIRCLVDDEDTKPVLYSKTSVMAELMDAVKTSMKLSNVISSIQFHSITVLKNHIDSLSKAIETCPSLQNINLTHCLLGDDNVQKLCNTVIKHTGINTLDLSACCITNKGAKYIADLIKAQRFARYSETWKQSLRYRIPDPEIVPGLRRITLNDNTEIEDEGFSLICHELLDDLWLKALDMQNCGLTKVSANNALDLVKINPTINVLDIRRNKVSNDLLKKIKFNLINKDQVSLNNPKFNNLDSIQVNDKVYKWLDGHSDSISNIDSANSTTYSSSSSIKVSTHNNNIINNNNNSNIFNNNNKLTPDVKLRLKRFDESRRRANELKKLLNERTNILLMEKEKSKLLEEKNKDILKKVSKKMVKEWHKRKTIEKERDHLKKKLKKLKNKNNGNKLINKINGNNTVTTNNSTNNNINVNNINNNKEINERSKSLKCLLKVKNKTKKTKSDEIYNKNNNNIQNKINESNNINNNVYQNKTTKYNDMNLLNKKNLLHNIRAKRNDKRKNLQNKINEYNNELNTTNEKESSSSEEKLQTFFKQNDSTLMNSSEDDERYYKNKNSKIDYQNDDTKIIKEKKFNDEDDSVDDDDGYDEDDEDEYDEDEDDRRVTEEEIELNEDVCYRIGQTKEELNNLEEKINKLILSSSEMNMNSRQSISTTYSNNDNVDDFRNLTPRSRSQWILKQIINGKKY